MRVSSVLPGPAGGPRMHHLTVSLLKERPTPPAGEIRAVKKSAAAVAVMNVSSPIDNELHPTEAEFPLD